MRHAILSLCAAAALAGCAATERFYTLPEAPAETLGTQRIRYGSVELRDLSLPDYAARQEIALRGADGSLAAPTGTLWADDPSRAMTLALVRDLRRITGAEIASEPWPFADRAEARLELRVERMLEGEDGAFHLAGQYFLAPDDPDRRGRSGLFDIAVPLAGEAGGPGAVAAASGTAVTRLAQFLAREALR